MSKLLKGPYMSRITRFWLIICTALIGISGAGLAYGCWSQGFTQNYPPEAYGPFTKMEFFILPVPGAADSVTFAEPTSIFPCPRSSNNWVSTTPNPWYSLLTSTGTQANTAYLTVFFTGPRSSEFDLDFVLWNGNTVTERQEFEWLGGHWASPTGTLIENANGTFSAGDYNRNPLGTSAPIPPTLLLLAPAGLGVLLFRRRLFRTFETIS